MSVKDEPMPEQGNPTSPKCRWCSGRRVLHLGWLVCPKCDRLEAKP